MRYLTLDISGKKIAKSTCPTERLCFNETSNVIVFGTGDFVLTLNEFGHVGISDQGGGSPLSPYFNYDVTHTVEYISGTWMEKGFICGPPGFVFDIYFPQNFIVDPSEEGVTLHLYLGNRTTNIATGLVGPYELPTSQNYPSGTMGYKVTGQIPNPVTPPPGETFPYTISSWDEIHIGDGYGTVLETEYGTNPIVMKFFNSYGACYEYVRCHIKGYYNTTY